MFTRCVRKVTVTLGSLAKLLFVQRKAGQANEKGDRMLAGRVRIPVGSHRKVEKQYLRPPAECLLRNGCNETVHARHCRCLVISAAFTAKVVARPTAKSKRR